MSAGAHKGQVVTFYSYKGGTGRTMAVANVGCVLASRHSPNRRVLLIDWDLEAPGLHRYFPETVNPDQPRAGVIDLFEELSDAVSCDAAPLEPELIVEQIDLHRFVEGTNVEGVFVMVAGRFDDRYAARVNAFDWAGLHERSPNLFRALGERLAAAFDFVLIDSRTGITDTSGICTGLLPEKLVAVFTPNRQSLDGVIELVRRSVRYRLRSDDLRPLTVFPLPSRVDTAEPKLEAEWRRGSKTSGFIGYQATFEALFADAYAIEDCDLTQYFDGVRIAHVPQYAYGEDVAIVVEQDVLKDKSLTRSYAFFASQIVALGSPWSLELSNVSDFDVLVSFANSDAAVAWRIGDELIRRGVRAWLHYEQLRPAARYEKTYLEIVGKARVGVVLLGQHQSPMDFQRKEIAALLDAKRRRSAVQVIPVLLPGVVNVPRELESLERISMRSMEDVAAYDRLAAFVLGS